MSAVFLDENERSALGRAQQGQLRVKVVDHVCAKLVLPPGMDKQKMRGVVAQSYDIAAMKLQRYSDASYASYVFLTLIYLMLGEQVMASPEPWRWLNNDRVGINTRIRLAYLITKDAASRAG